MIIPGHKLKDLGVVEPFCERTVSNGMTYGVGSGGYDVRLKDELYLPQRVFTLGVTIERFKIPNDVMAFVYDKSSWARCGLQLFNTVIEAGWEGYLTLELVNHAPRVLHIPAGAPIAQIIFEPLQEETPTPYRGKYQNQPARPVEAIHEADRP